MATVSTTRPAVETEVSKFMEGLTAKHPHEPEFLQAVREVVGSVMPVYLDTPAYQQANLLERMTEPDRMLSFRVTWEDDQGKVRVNRGYRVEFNSSIGPYKGGLRFHPTVYPGLLKFLGFEQVFKNSLTTLPMGGGKGGSDFDPKGKSDREVMRFCQAFMSELWRHIGPDTDVPAGDIGVGGREIGYLFGQYRKLANEFTGVLTGKGIGWGGSLIRPEATGYGCVYFTQHMLNRRGDSFKGKSVAVSGSGNVAIYASEKLIELGAKVVTLSDSSGFIYDPDGMNAEKLAFVKDLKEVKRGRIKEYAGRYTKAEFNPGRPWKVEADVALPCATQNELDLNDAKGLIAGGVIAVAEGANMPTTEEATEALQKAGVMFAPGKAANAGGVAVSGLEMSQNSLRLSWTRKEVDAKLAGIMESIHTACVKYGADKDTVNYVKGANIAGFVKIADAMVAQGLV
ncbi:MAG: NADP-specific glutamate dehydrogenase [Phycisphaerales bacterium]|nr:NADP-specific glutamate dehydrogenase [Phycisphaerales bacterium]